MSRSLAGEKIVIATHNRGKLAEFRQLLAPRGIAVTSAGELGLPEPEETETTFRGNAEIKALSALKDSGLVAIADDSGLSVEALDGAPGVYTADWAGPGRDWLLAMTKVNDLLTEKGARTPDQRRAAFLCTLCVAWPDGEIRFYEGRSPGHLTWPPRGVMGHGYDPVFVPEGASLTFGEMAADQKNAVSHRSRALAALMADLF